MALQSDQLTLCGVNERYSPPVVMFLEPRPEGDKEPVLMVQVQNTVYVILNNTITIQAVYFPKRRALNKKLIYSIYSYIAYRDALLDHWLAVVLALF